MSRINTATATDNELLRWLWANADRTVTFCGFHEPGKKDAFACHAHKCEGHVEPDDWWTKRYPTPRKALLAAVRRVMA